MASIQVIEHGHGFGSEKLEAGTAKVGQHSEAEARRAAGQYGSISGVGITSHDF